MRQNILMPMAVAAVVVGSGAFTEAHAESPWYALGDMRIGGIHFSVGLDSGHRGHYGEYARYYRTNHRLRYKGRQCGSFCFRRNRDYYHHESCALLGAHFRRYEYGPPDWAFWPRPYGGYFFGDRDDYRERRFEKRYERRRHGRRGRRGRW